MVNDLNTTRVLRVAGICALLGVLAAFWGSAVGAVHGLGGQEIPLATEADLLELAQSQSTYLIREWLFLLYAILLVAEGVGLYYLTRPAGSLAVWAFVAWTAGIFIGIVQDAALVAFVTQFPPDYAAADAATRLALEPLARTVGAIIGVQQSVANGLLGIALALYSVAVLRTCVGSRAYGVFGIVAAASSLLYALVIGSASRFDNLQSFAEQAFGMAVMWDLWTGIVMLRYREPPESSILQND